MATKVTIQDIASELQLSRNTVSKAINNTGVLADATREKILRKAAEMGYKQFAYLPLFQENAAISTPPYCLNTSFIFSYLYILFYQFSYYHSRVDTYTSTPITPLPKRSIITLPPNSSIKSSICFPPPIQPYPQEKYYNAYPLSTCSCSIPKNATA